MGLEISTSVIIIFILISSFIIFLAVRADNKKRKKSNFTKDVYKQTVKYGIKETFQNNNNGSYTFKLKSKMNKN